MLQAAPEDSALDRLYSGEDPNWSDDFFDQADIEQASETARRVTNNEGWIGDYQSSPYTGAPNRTEQYNAANPGGEDASLPYVQGGRFGGWLDGVGETIGEGRSLTPGQFNQHVDAAMASGIDEGWLNDFLRRNPGDANRAIEAYRSEQQGGGRGSSGSSRGSSGGGMSGGRAGGPDFISPFIEQFRAPTMDEVKNSPGYGLRLDEALGTLKRARSAQGTMLTGGTFSDLSDVAAGHAVNEYGREYDRRLGEYQQRFDINRANERDRFGSQRTNRMDDFSILTGDRNYELGSRGLDIQRELGLGGLGIQGGYLGLARDRNDFDIWNTLDNNNFNRNLSLAEMGYRSGSSLAGAGQNYADQAGNAITNQANANAAAQVGSANNWADTLSGIGSSLWSLDALRRLGG